MFTYFDALGPGDTSPSSRWPTEDTKLRSKLYISALTGALVQQLDANGTIIGGVQGTLSATANTPNADVTPAALQLITLGQLLIHE
jgi:hypothetical protein